MPAALLFTHRTNSEPILHSGFPHWEFLPQPFASID